jgi:hypothetical protein
VPQLEYDYLLLLLNKRRATGRTSSVQARRESLATSSIWPSSRCTYMCLCPVWRQVEGHLLGTLERLGPLLRHARTVHTVPSPIAMAPYRRISRPISLQSFKDILGPSYSERKTAQTTDSIAREIWRHCENRWALVPDDLLLNCNTHPRIIASPRPNNRAKRSVNNKHRSN